MRVHPTAGLQRTAFKAAVIGAGPAGIAAAAGLVKAGIEDLIIIEREPETGGILNQCIHNGFGLSYFGTDLTGPEFARMMESRFNEAASGCLKTEPLILTSSSVSEIERLSGGGFAVHIKSKDFGLLRVRAEAVITATGCRERTRENIEVPGTRPAGIFTAGQAQNLINRRHYSVGNRVVIQGSGDIGLIMARRLTLEGIKVEAVLERLPYLSGSIRNKVQCLDHFSIPLYLGRRLTDIRGRKRVTSVKTDAVDAGFNIIENSSACFECDTVLFAAGLIPELETVKPAGVVLSDGFHPDVNRRYETCTEGLFAAGNCLHINDLADSAAREGGAAAVSAAGYLKDRCSFREDAGIIGMLPYREPRPGTELTEEYFKKIRDENLTVCIVCPKGCLLSEGNYGCVRGEEYYRRTAAPASEARQRLHTTIALPNDATGKKLIVPAVSAEEVPAGIYRELIGKLKTAASDIGRTDNYVNVETGGRSYRFNLCRPETTG